jgi:hypothetical protein
MAGEGNAALKQPDALPTRDLSTPDRDSLDKNATG